MDARVKALCAPKQPRVIHRLAPDLYAHSSPLQSSSAPMAFVCASSTTVARLGKGPSARRTFSARSARPVRSAAKFQVRMRGSSR